MPVKKTTSSPKRKRLVLLDSHAIIHRAYHALPDFATSKGEPTGALYGLSTMLIRILSDLKPDYIAACYDLPGPTHRHEAYDAYKGKRKETEEALAVQLDTSRKIFEAFSIPIYEHPGFEADDCLGTIVEQVKNEPLDVIIASGDMDTLQLVDDKKVQVYTLKKGLNDTILYDEKAVRERFDFGPELLPDYKGLRGDPSDNIIGISGIGEKTATQLIVEFGTLEEMYKKLHRSKKIFEEKGVKGRIIELLEKGEEEALFSKTLATIRRDTPIKFHIPQKPWYEAIDLQTVLSLFRELEFRSLGERVKSLLGESGKEELKREESLSLESPRAEESFDPLEKKKLCVLAWVLDSNLTNPTEEDILGLAKTETLAEAKRVLLGELKKRGLEKVYRDIEEPLIPVVEKMEERGIRIDLDKLKELSELFHKELSALEISIWKEAGEEFNINSPKQLGVILFEKLGLTLKNHKKTSTGVKSTRESELEKLKDVHPIIPLILRHRELQKLVSTYVDAIPSLVKGDGRLHSTFLQAGAATGRMASQNPNLQNIPIKTAEGRRIREAFVAERGFVLGAFDYSQIELRIAAFLSGDKKLINIFKDGGDVHAAVAAEVFGVPPEKVDKEMRRRAKVINFGILYGMGVNALKVSLGSSQAEARKFYDAYFEKFSELASYLDKVKAEAARKGYTETLFGRRRYFEGIRSSIPFIRASAERMAINAPMQGTQADIIKIAMVHIDTEIEKRGWRDRVCLLLQVHDELIYEIEESIKEEAANVIASRMEGVLTKEETEGVPIIVGRAFGKSWGAME